MLDCAWDYLLPFVYSCPLGNSVLEKAATCSIIGTTLSQGFGPVL